MQPLRASLMIELVREIVINELDLLQECLLKEVHRPEADLGGGVGVVVFEEPPLQRHLVPAILQVC